MEDGKARSLVNDLSAEKRPINLQPGAKRRIPKERGGSAGQTISQFSDTKGEERMDAGKGGVNGTREEGVPASRTRVGNANETYPVHMSAIDGLLEEARVIVELDNSRSNRAIRKNGKNIEGGEEG